MCFTVKLSSQVLQITPIRRWTNSDAFSDEKSDVLSNSVNGFVKRSCISDSFSLSQEICLNRINMSRQIKVVTSCSNHKIEQQETYG